MSKIYFANRKKANPQSWRYGTGDKRNKKCQIGEKKSCREIFSVNYNITQTSQNGKLIKKERVCYSSGKFRGWPGRYIPPEGFEISMVFLYFQRSKSGSFWTIMPPPPLHSYKYFPENKIWQAIELAPNLWYCYKNCIDFCTHQAVLQVFNPVSKLIYSHFATDSMGNITKKICQC